MNFKVFFLMKNYSHIYASNFSYLGTPFPEINKTFIINYIPLYFIEINLHFYLPTLGGNEKLYWWRQLVGMAK